MVGKQETTQETPQEEADRLLAEKVHKERSLKAKMKEELQEKEELDRILEEKKVIEDELDELRSSLLTTNMERSNYTELIEKKFLKVKKKLEKKLKDAKKETEQLKDVSDDYAFDSSMRLI